jgi:hypothetical protein
MKVLNAVSVQSRKRVLEKLKSGLSFVLHTSRQIGRDGRVRGAPSHCQPPRCDVSHRPVVDGRERPLCGRRIKLLNFPVKVDVHVAVFAAALGCYAFIRVLWQSPRGVLVPLTGISALVPNVLCAKYLGSECR